MYLLHRKKIGIYANISLFLSYSGGHRSHPIRYLSSPDGHCSHQNKAVSRSDDGSAPRDDLYSSERQQRPGHLDENWPPRLRLVSPKVFFSILSPMEFWFFAVVTSGLLSWGHFICSEITDLIAQILFKLN